HGADDQARGQARRQVLHRVDTDIDLAPEERLLDLLHEQALQAGRRLGPALGAVAARANVDGLDAEPRMPGDERIVDARGLRSRSATRVGTTSRLVNQRQKASTSASTMVSALTASRARAPRFWATTPSRSSMS